jgi:thiamine pyrophosphokinase
MPDTTALVVCGGGPVRAPLPPTDGSFVIAADGGLVEARRLGLHVHVLIGDLDSVPPEAVAAARDAGTRVQAHPADKDATDLELALEAALAMGARRILVAGGDGGRFDHLLGNAFQLASARWAGVEMDAVLGAAWLHVVRGSRDLTADAGEVLSLFAAGGIARDITTDGLRWALRGDDLLPGSSRGISNIVERGPVSIRVAEGALLAIRPGTEAP